MNNCPTKSFYIVFHYLIRLGNKCADSCISSESDGGALDLSTGDPIYLKPRAAESFYIGILRLL